MALLSRYGILSTAQIHRLVFKGIRKSTMLRRLRLIEKAKMIRRVYALPDGGAVWLLATKGEKDIGAERSAPAVNRHSITHDLTVLEVRLAFERHGICSHWKTDWELKRQIHAKRYRVDPAPVIVPDGIFSGHFHDRVRAVALEVELSPKTMRRYEKIFQKYRWQSSIGMIWYIVQNKSFGFTLLKKWQTTIPDRKGLLRFSLVDDVLTNLVAAPIYGGEDEPPTVGDYFAVRPPAHTPAHGVSTPDQAAA